MRESRPDEGSRPASAKQRSLGGEAPCLRVLLENEITNGKRRWRMGMACLVQGALLGLAVLLPLLFTESIELTGLRGEVILAPPPKGDPTGDVKASGGRAPRRVPPQRADLSEKLHFPISPVERPSVEGVSGTEGGTGPGEGVPGVPEGIESGGPLVGDPRVLKLPPPLEPVKVGGRIRAPRVLRRVEPDYPAWAQRAGVQGEVVLEAVLGANRRVQQVSVVRGHPALARVAAAAVEQWLYEPTYLNDQPVPVVLEVLVQFKLRR